MSLFLDDAVEFIIKTTPNDELIAQNVGEVDDRSDEFSRRFAHRLEIPNDSLRAAIT